MKPADELRERAAGIPQGNCEPLQSKQMRETAALLDECERVLEFWLPSDEARVHEDLRDDYAKARATLAKLRGEQ